MTTKSEKPVEPKADAIPERDTVASLAKRLDAVEAALKTGDPHAFALSHKG